MLETTSFFRESAVECKKKERHSVGGRPEEKRVKEEKRRYSAGGVRRESKPTREANKKFSVFRQAAVPPIRQRSLPHLARTDSGQSVSGYPAIAPQAERLINLKNTLQREVSGGGLSTASTAVGTRASTRATTPATSAVATRAVTPINSARQVLEPLALRRATSLLPLTQVSTPKNSARPESSSPNLKEWNRDLADSVRKNRDTSADFSTVIGDSGWATSVLATLPPRKAGSKKLKSYSRQCSTKSWRERLCMRKLGTFPIEECSSRRPIDASLELLPDPDEIAAWHQTEFETFPEAHFTNIQRAFKCFGQHEVPSKHLKSILSHIGFFGVQDAIVGKLAREISTYPMFSFDEVIRLTEKYAACDYERFTTAFQRLHAGQAAATLSLQKVIELLRSMGMRPLNATLSQMLGTLGKSKSSEFTLDHVIRLMSHYRATEGFSRKEIDFVHEVFRIHAVHTAANGIMMKGAQALDGLLQVFGLNTSTYAKKLTEHLSENSESEFFLDFRSFLVFARRLREAEMFDFCKAFSGIDTDADGLISSEMLGESLRRLGYSPNPALMDDVLKEVNLTWLRHINFDVFVRFVRIVKFREGFSESELEEYASLFNAFDTDLSDTIDCHELRKVMRQLGHNMSLAEVRSQLKPVDVNGDGVLNFEEFLHFIRLHRENERKRAHVAFREALIGKGDCLEKADIQSTMSALGLKPSMELIEQIMDSAGTQTLLTFDEFCNVLEECRKASAIEHSKQAYWSHDEFELLRKRFIAFGADEGMRVSKGKFLWILMDLGIKIQTAKERNVIFGKIEEARNHALRAGVDGDLANDIGDSSVTVWVLAHLLRLIAQGSEDEDEERETAAREETKFSHAEIAEFSDIFLNNLVEEGKDVNDGESPRQSPILRKLIGDRDADRRRSVSSLRYLLKTLGVQVSLEERRQLKAKVIEINRGGASFDFPDFLRIIRWILDTNFANILSVTRSFSVGYTSFPGVLQKPRLASQAVNISRYWQLKAPQTPLH